MVKVILASPALFAFLQNDSVHLAVVHQNNKQTWLFFFMFRSLFLVVVSFTSFFIYITLLWCFFSTVFFITRTTNWTSKDSVIFIPSHYLSLDALCSPGDSHPRKGHLCFSCGLTCLETNSDLSSINWLTNLSEFIPGCVCLQIREEIPLS